MVEMLDIAAMASGIPVMSALLGVVVKGVAAAIVTKAGADAIDVGACCD